MDYNKTINLPQTEFPMRAGLPNREPGMLEGWKKIDVYNELLKKNAGKPSFVLHAVPCLFFALRIFERCKAWSNIPQITIFLFQFLASICVMLAVYQLACFDVNLGKRKTCLFWSLSGVYFSLLSLPSGDEPLFYVGMAIWLLTNLCSVRPLKARKPQQTEPAPETTPEPAPEAAAPEAPAPAPTAESQLNEDMSLDDLKRWLDKE